MSFTRDIRTNLLNNLYYILKLFKLVGRSRHSKKRHSNTFLRGSVPDKFVKNERNQSSFGSVPSMQRNKITRRTRCSSNNARFDKIKVRSYDGISQWETTVSEIIRDKAVRYDYKRVDCRHGRISTRMFKNTNVRRLLCSYSSVTEIQYYFWHYLSPSTKSVLYGFLIFFDNFAISRETVFFSLQTKFVYLFLRFNYTHLYTQYNI